MTTPYPHRLTVDGTPVEEADLVLVLAPRMPVPRFVGYVLQSTARRSLGVQVRRYSRLEKMAPGTTDPRD